MIMSTATASRRQVHYNSFDEVLADAERAVQGKAETTGNWSLGRILEHLAIANEKSIDGFGFQAPLPVRMIAGTFLKKRLLKNGLKPGFQLSKRGCPGSRPRRNQRGRGPRSPPPLGGAPEIGNEAIPASVSGFNGGRGIELPESAARGVAYEFRQTVLTSQRLRDRPAKSFALQNLQTRTVSQGKHFERTRCELCPSNRFKSPASNELCGGTATHAMWTKFSSRNIAERHADCEESKRTCRGVSV